MKTYQIIKLYYVNTFPNPSGDHEVHKEGCQHVPNFLSRKFLDYYSSCKEAIKEAKKTYPTANGCKTCLEECHKSE